MTNEAELRDRLAEAIVREDTPHQIAQAIIDEFELDAHNTLPKALSALRAVMELHSESEHLRTVPLWSREIPEDDEPYHGCVGCNEPWPCMTFQTIQEAINE